MSRSEHAVLSATALDQCVVAGSPSVDPDSYLHE